MDEMEEVERRVQMTTDETPEWPTDLAVAVCLRQISADLENGTAEVFCANCAAVETLSDDTSPFWSGSETGFRAWLNHFGGLSSEEIDAAVLPLKNT
jgi:hypothetical protein